MTLIKCPHCGHTVLSVASQCPACHGELRSAYLGQEHTGELAQCRFCGQRVRTYSRKCPHCGRANPASRVGARELAMGGGILLALAVATAVLWPWIMPRQPAEDTAAQLVAPAEPTPAATAPTAGGAPSSQAEIRAPAPGPATVAAERPNPLAGVRLQTRYTSAWVNLRAGPDTTATVLRALAPGTEVSGARGALGWWAIQLAGDSIGYIAGALLALTPPLDTLPPPSR